MVVQINVKNPDKLKKGDILIFDGEKFDVITVEQITKDLLKSISKMEEEIVMLNDKMKKTRQETLIRQKRFVKAFMKGE